MLVLIFVGTSVMVINTIVAMMLWWKPVGLAPAFTIAVQRAAFVSRSSLI